MNRETLKLRQTRVATSIRALWLRAVPTMRLVFYVIVSSLFVPTVQAQFSASGPLLIIVSCTKENLEAKVLCPDGDLAYEQAQSLVQGAFYDDKFDTLDALYKSWCTGSERFPNGHWKLAEFSRGFEIKFRTWKNWSQDIAAIKRWQKALPESDAAKYAEAIYWHIYAWNARGGGTAGTVSAEAWELFRERMQFARDALEKLRDANCPAPLADLLYVLIETGASDAELRSLYRIAARKYPQYHEIYFAMSKKYDPKWGGSVEQFEKFASEVAARTQAFEGDGLYARMFARVDTNRGIPFRPMTSGIPQWQKLKRGYEDLMRRYPSSMLNLGRYLSVACRSSESELYRSLRSKLAGHENEAEMLDSMDVCDRRHRWAPVKQ